jgi:hypothetical protein
MHISSFAILITMQPSDPRFVSSSRPLNRRTARLASPVKQELNPLVKRQLAAIKAKHTIGLPLFDQIQIKTSGGVTKQFQPQYLFLGLVSAASLAGTVLAGIEQSFILASVSGLALLASASWLWFVRKNALQHSSIQAGRAQLLSIESIIAFDRAIAALYEEQQASENQNHHLPLQKKFDDLKSILLKIKAQFVRIHQLTMTTRDQDALSLDDQLYLNACLQRYLPDSLESYLRVPAQARLTQAIQGELTALDLLLNQLQLLHTEIDQREQGLTKNAAEQLMRQQRFLEAKSRHQI